MAVAAAAAEEEKVLAAAEKVAAAAAGAGAASLAAGKEEATVDRGAAEEAGDLGLRTPRLERNDRPATGIQNPKPRNFSKKLENYPEFRIKKKTQKYLKYLKRSI